MLRRRLSTSTSACGLPRQSNALGLYGVWAAYTGDRALSAELMEGGYGRFCVGRFMQTLEYRGRAYKLVARQGAARARMTPLCQGVREG